MFKLQVFLFGVLVISQVQGQSSTQTTTSSSSSAPAGIPSSSSATSEASGTSGTGTTTTSGFGIPPATGETANLASFLTGVPLAGFSKNAELTANPALMQTLQGLFGSATRGDAAVGAATAGAPLVGGFPFAGGLVGPSYLPKTFLGSAFGAKGDILFPVVIGLFVVVGVWTVLKLLIDLAVPIIGKKLLPLDLLKKKIARSADPQDLTSASHLEDPEVAELSKQVAECIRKGEIKFAHQGNKPHA